MQMSLDTVHVGLLGPCLKCSNTFFFQMFTTFFSHNLLSVEMPDMFSVHYGNAMKMTSFHKGKNPEF